MKPFISRKDSHLMSTVHKISSFVTIVMENTIHSSVSNRSLARHWKQWKWPILFTELSMEEYRVPFCTQACHSNLIWLIFFTINSSLQEYLCSGRVVIGNKFHLFLCERNYRNLCISTSNLLSYGLFKFDSCRVLFVRSTTVLFIIAPCDLCTAQLRISDNIFCFISPLSSAA